MTRYYYYIECGAQIDSDSCFFRVGIGNSERERAILQWISAYALEHGHYFVISSLEALDFVALCMRSVQRNLNEIEYISGRDLKKHLQKGDEVPQLVSVFKNYDYMMKKLNVDYRVNCYLNLKKAGK